MQNNNLKNWLAFNHLCGLRIDERHYLIDAIKADEVDFSAQLYNRVISENIREQIKRLDWSLIENELKWSESTDHHIVTFEDSTYPKLLYEIASPPPVLFVEGDVPCLQEPQLAMVGSRHPTPIGIETAERFSAFLTKIGLVITSGLASGIDGASHRGALANGKTIAVLGTGLGSIYPRQHQKLAKEIAEQGALVSEFPLHTPPKRENFPRRNRIISGLSLGVLVVEAALNSGSLITARFAGEQNREIYAIPGSIHQPLARGCHRLIRNGAKLVETALDIIEELQVLRSLSLQDLDGQQASEKTGKSFEQFKKKGGEKLDDDDKKLLSCIGNESTAFDTIAFRSGFDAKIISSIILKLELKGYVISVSGGYCLNKGN